MNLSAAPALRGRLAIRADYCAFYLSAPRRARLDILTGRIR